MFTGIVEEVGIVKNITRGISSAVIEIEAKEVLRDISLGDSIAVNGACLTVVSYNEISFKADVMSETIRRTGFSKLVVGSKVNLERAMSMEKRFGGHIVSGHIDGVGIIKQIIKEDNAVWYKIKASKDILRYIVMKGSITIDGISLTVAKVGSEDFSISAIPFTRQQTTLGVKRIGDLVNIENDCIGKYVERLMQIEKSDSNITKEFLQKFGF